MDEEAKQSLILEFLARLATDRAAGRAIALQDYLEDYPGAENIIAEAFSSGGRAVISTTNREAASSTEQRIGSYTIERELGRGGQGRVFLARDERLGRIVALKVIPRSPFALDPSPRLRREAELSAALDHPGLCPIYEMGNDDALEWMALRYVPGETLAQRIRTAAPRALEVADVLEIGHQAGIALHFAHEAGVVHRDVKPSNLMVTPEGRVVVLDFGIARDDATSDSLTQTSQIPGTPAYMAPETFVSSPAQLGRSIDVWGLGASLYEALTGRRPFDGATRESLSRTIQSIDPPPPSQWNSAVSRDLDCVIQTALSKEISRRYQTAEDLAEDLRRVRDRLPIRARPASTWVHVDRFCRRNPALAGALLALLLVLGIGLFTTGALLVDVKQTLKQKEAVLADFVQLADQKITRDLLGLENELWPAEPSRIPEFESWLARSREVLARRERHVEVLTRPAASSTERHELAVDQDEWLREQLTQLLRDLDELEKRVPGVEARLEFAREVHRRSIEEPAGEWRRARENVAADPRFAATPGFELTPQLGLIPLGPDPESGLEEFAVLSTGTPPRRDVATRRLIITADMALVLVLVPGGTAVLGAMQPSAEQPVGAPRVDPNAQSYESPLVRVRLDPFFLSKFEMTQQQWFHHTGQRPATYGDSSRFVEADGGARHPVETVSAEEATRVLRQIGLLLPTEAQWEFATRAGTDTVYFTGDEPGSLQGFANIADRYAKEHDGSPNWRFCDALDDGYTAHAPIGTYGANRFGLHELLGNVNEICRDTWEDWSLVPPRDGDGECIGKELARACRGGDYGSDVHGARSSARTGIQPQTATHTHGFRPSRVVARKR